MKTTGNAALLLPLTFAVGCAGSASPASTPSAPIPTMDAGSLFARYKSATGGGAWSSMGAIES